MARGNGQLYLQVGANIDNLTTQMKAARSAVLNWGDQTTDIVERVRKEFANIGGDGGFAKSAQQIDAGFKKTIQQIKANVEELSRAGSPGKAIQLLDAQASEEAARAKLAQAAALQAVARAAQTATHATEADAQSARELAASSAAAAISLEQEAAALNDNARVLRTVDGQLQRTAGASGALAVAGGRNTASAGQQRLAFQQLGFQINDVATGFASGQRPMQIFAQQGGQLIQALSLMTNSTKGFLGFLGGPWGAVLTAATIVLVPLVGKLLEGNSALDDAVDKLKADAAQTDASRQAKELFGRTVEGVAAAIRDGTEATRKSIEADRDAAEAANIAAKQELNKEIAIRKATAARLADAIAQQSAASGGGGGIAGTQGFIQGQSDLRVIDLKKRLAESEQLIKEAEARIQETRVQLAVEAAARQADPIKRINKLYDDRARAVKEAARAEIAAGRQVTAALTAQLADNEAQRQRALKAEQARQGVALRKVLNEPAQRVYHVEFGKAGPTAETLAKRQEAEAKRGRADQDKAADLLAAAMDRQAAAEADLADDSERRLQIEIDRIDAARRNRDRELVVEALDNRFIAANLDRLKALNASSADIDKQLLTRRRAQQIEEDSLARSRAASDDAVTLLQIQERIAGTQSQRDEIERRILAIKQQEERDALQRIIDNRTGKYSANDIAIAQDQLATLPARQAAQRQDLGRQQSGPIDQYKQQLQSNVGDINSALEGVGATGLRSLEDGLVGVINGTKSVADAFKDMAASIISDIARILVEKALLSLLGLSDGGLVGGGGVLGVIGFADGGKVPGYALGGLPGFAGGSHPFVSNGIIHGRGSGRSDSILALVNQKVPIMVSNGEAIVNERGVRKHWPLIDAINHDRLGPISGFADGGIISPGAIRLRPLPDPRSLAVVGSGGGSPIVFDLRGAVVTEDLLRQMNEISARNAQVAVIGGSRMAQQEIANRELMKIPT